MNRSHKSALKPSTGRLPGFRASALRLLLAGLLPLISVLASAATHPRQPGPEISFTFESLGIPGLSQNFLNAGGSMLTVNFIDSTHMLLSFSLRDLVPRIPGDPPEDDDRLVGAELIELPSGKVLAHTRWHLHDHGRYLWSLGQGRFLVRQGGDLSTFAPLANLGTEDPFRRVAFPHRGGVLDAIVVSADGKLLTIESHAQEKKPAAMNVNTLTTDDLSGPKPAVIYDFYRMEGSGSATAPFMTTRAGTVESSDALRLPVDGDGYLVASGGKRGRWNVEFVGFGEKGQPVGLVESNCSPGLELVSPTQWLAFTCRSAGSDGVTMAAYDFAKHDIWEEPMGSFATSAPAFALAPSAGRFAISRRIDTPAPGIATDNSGSLSSQEVRVYGTQTGDLLLKVFCQPVFRTSENFDLSPDGMRLAAVRNGSIEIYRLPELTKLDREDLAELGRLTPPTATGPVNLRRLARADAREATASAGAAAADEVPKGDAAAVPATAAAAALPAMPVPDAIATIPSGDSDEGASGDTQVRRKPPTLLAPGEKAEGGSKDSQKQN